MIIVFEGIDGSGKGTQAAAFADYLTSKGKPNALFSFPDYSGTHFGKEVGKYLNGLYGDLKTLPPQFPAMLYAMDRFEVKPKILAALEAGKIVIFDRYVASNFIYQSAKLAPSDRQGFIEWVKQLEYEIQGMPKPDVTVLLDVPPTIASDNVLKKSTRAYTSSKKDMHEKDNSYLEKVYEVYKKIAVDDGWFVVDCTINGVMKNPKEILEQIVNGCKI